ncbi:hypothetical protein BA896_023370 [Janthinobacterium lividum]|uniref:Uncharacterized protein n=1 Tax=Janthinobacterium lividum TaxID=29581 RepID=A0A1E8PMZ2_9BURK|nr:hypothetical protein BA896_023370 [Janthinobacterium lividum]
MFRLIACIGQHAADISLNADVFGNAKIAVDLAIRIAYCGDSQIDGQMHAIFTHIGPIVRHGNSISRFGN